MQAQLPFCVSIDPVACVTRVYTKCGVLLVLDSLERPCHVRRCIYVHCLVITKLCRIFGELTFSSPCRNLVPSRSIIYKLN